MGRAKSDKVLVSFSGGEWEPQLDTRIDLAKAANACRTLKNFRTDIYGGAVKRPGLRYIGSLKGKNIPDTTPFNLFSIDNTVTDFDFWDDGNILLTGSFATVCGENRDRIAIASAAGVVEAVQLTPNVGPNFARVVDGSASGWYVVGGDFVQLNPGAISRVRVAGINRDGTLHTGFQDPQITGGLVADGLIDANGKILVVGQFTSVNGVATNYITRLNQDGTTDATFTTPTLTSFIRRVILQDDGKILIVGAFDSVAGQSRKQIARLEADGSLDSTFTQPLANSDGYGVNVGPDGKVYLGVQFATLSAINNRGKLGRLDSGGTYDTSFAPAIGTFASSTACDTMVILDNGDVIAGGNFESTGGVSTPNITCVDSTGLLRATWASGAPTADGDVDRIKRAANDVIWACGIFTSINGSSRSRIAKIQASTGLVISLT